jgi:hypothetical protein
MFHTRLGLHRASVLAMWTLLFVFVWRWVGSCLKLQLLGRTGRCAAVTTCYSLDLMLSEPESGQSLAVLAGPPSVVHAHANTPSLGPKCILECVFLQSVCCVTCSLLQPTKLGYMNSRCNNDCLIKCR